MSQWVAGLLHSIRQRDNIQLGKLEGKLHLWQGQVGSSSATCYLRAIHEMATCGADALRGETLLTGQWHVSGC